ncbi:succinylglutamate desuccinylase/aspartoacylase family protein [Leeia sp. TBRC 13508]|uniref:Succinylglutamate desuccinylase/aspartoacylase family protein n=1 Tax=Leeia speluncae TaxID=2884804 RepID=A0ABS8D9D6_9NEIS|nr:succinylglutamate desuccinylase/aspartoacylase family protein [Leeia speluncae]MCB6184829.1 succinylglutamate desuccinylase/aspartoacylase family protein [Leeia speluncae]
MKTQTHALISPALGTQREVISYHFGNEGQGKKVYIQSSLHADELPGMLTAWQLRQQLTALEAEGKLIGEVVLVPVCNPIGLNQRLQNAFLGRFELGSGENFNRNYPDITEELIAAVDGQLSQNAEENVRLIRQTAKAILKARQSVNELDSLRTTLLGLLIDADVFLDLHCDWEAALHLYTGTSVWPTVEPLARYLGAYASLLSLECGGAPIDDASFQIWWKLREHFGDQFPIPDATACVTVELRGQSDITHELAKQDADNLIAYLTWLGVVGGDVPPQPDLIYPATPLAGTAPVKAPVSGVIVHRSEVGQFVKAGEPLMDIVNPHHDEVTTLYAPVDGVLYQRHFVRFAHTGMDIARIAGSEATRSGKLLGA